MHRSLCCLAMTFVECGVIARIPTESGDEAIYICNMGGYVYIMSNINNSTLYVGVTSNLPVRTLQHKQKEFAGFTAKYNCTKLVYYKRYDSIEEAIAEEKRIKGGSRKKKELLINSMNPEWRDLYEEIV